MTALRVFEAAARLLSFKDAAKELNLSQSAVSHQIASLERYLGTALFRRLPGRVELNQKGRIYYPVVQESLDRIAITTDLIREVPTEGALTVQVYVTVAVRWLIPKLPHFKEVAPKVAVSLDASLLDWEFIPDRADVGFIYTRTPDRPNVTYTLLRREHLVAVCSKAIADTVKRPEDLRNIPILAVSGTDEDASIWAESIGLTTLTQKSSPLFDSNLLAIEAAINGQGIVVVPKFLVDADLRSGNLVIPIETDVMQPGGWYLTHLARRGNEKPIKMFIDWVRSL
ncbi:LysR substrate-binding domain-containing protein [Mesorhizobium sp. A623]